jgi:hypothetical protein
METSLAQNAITPPKLIPSLTQGVTTVANHIYLMLMPIVLDLFLWFGPHLSFEKLLQGVFASIKTSLASFADMAGALDSYESILKSVQQLNFFSMLRSLPIGVPSLLQWAEGSKTPLGSYTTISVENSNTALLLFLGMSILGIILGSIYLYSLASVTTKEKSKSTIKLILWTIFQCLILSLALLIAFFIILIPVSLLSDIMMVLAPGLYEIAIFVVGIFIIWLLMPLIFAAHGIFVERKNAIQSIMLSIRMVRSYLPGTGLFVLTAVLIYLGLNILWSKPPMNSWLLLIGIFGHAFIATSLLTASFIFYRGGLAWMKEKIRRSLANPKINQA